MTMYHMPLKENTIIMTLVRERVIEFSLMAPCARRYLVRPPPTINGYELIISHMVGSNKRNYPGNYSRQLRKKYISNPYRRWYEK